MMFIEYETLLYCKVTCMNCKKRKTIRSHGNQGIKSCKSVVINICTATNVHDMRHFYSSDNK